MFDSSQGSGIAEQALRARNQIRREFFSSRMGGPTRERASVGGRSLACGARLTVTSGTAVIAGSDGASSCRGEDVVGDWTGRTLWTTQQLAFFMVDGCAASSSGGQQQLERTM